MNDNQNTPPPSADGPPEAEQGTDGGIAHIGSLDPADIVPDVVGRVYATKAPGDNPKFVIEGDGGMYATDADGNVVTEFRDPYRLAFRSAPIFSSLLAEFGEQWADDPIPFPDAPNMDLLRHLWCIGGEHHSATFVGGVYAESLQAMSGTLLTDPPLQVEDGQIVDEEYLTHGDLCPHDEDTCGHPSHKAGGGDDGA